MAELSTRDSFIVRVYRYDTKDGTRIAGLIEALDGSGVSEGFANMHELGAILNRLVNRPLTRREEHKRSRTISER